MLATCASFKLLIISADSFPRIRGNPCFWSHEEEFPPFWMGGGGWGYMWKKWGLKAMIESFPPLMWVKIPSIILFLHKTTLQDLYFKKITWFGIGACTTTRSMDLNWVKISKVSNERVNTLQWVSKPLSCLIFCFLLHTKFEFRFFMVISMQRW